MIKLHSIVDDYARPKETRKLFRRLYRADPWVLYDQCAKCGRRLDDDDECPVCDKG